MSALSPRVPLTYSASEIERGRLHAIHVEKDFQSLHAHMITCAARRGVPITLRCTLEAARTVMLLRIVASVLCAAALGLALGSLLRLVFAA